MRFTRKRTRFVRRTKKKATRKFKSKVKTVIRSVGAMPELKTAVHVFNGATLTNNSPHFFGLNIPASSGGALDRGVLRGNRLGDEIQMVGISVRFQSYILDGANSEGFPIRVMVVYDKSPEGVQFNTSDVLINGLAATETINGSRNPYNRSQYRVLYDRTYDHKKRTTQALLQDAHTWKINLRPRKPLPTTYYHNVPSNFTIADIRSGALYVWMVAGGPTSGQVITSNLSYVIYFRDA